MQRPARPDYHPARARQPPLSTIPLVMAPTSMRSCLGYRPAVSGHDWRSVSLSNTRDLRRHNYLPHAAADEDRQKAAEHRRLLVPQDRLYARCRPTGNRRHVRPALAVAPRLGPSSMRLTYPGFTWRGFVEPPTRHRATATRGAAGGRPGTKGVAARDGAVDHWVPPHMASDPLHI